MYTKAGLLGNAVLTSALLRAGVARKRFVTFAWPKLVRIVDSHTGGEATRVVTAGRIRGAARSMRASRRCERSRTISVGGGERAARIGRCRHSTAQRMLLRQARNKHS